MTLPSNDHAYLRNVAPDQLAALIFELASQLHVERQRRIALETALQRAGLLQTDTLDALAADTEIQNMGREALDLALRRLLRVVTETGDPRGPLRAEHC
ncbi:hypothetical protein KFK14_04975 [Sphingobium phenoxybenzoativorans]|uniref:Uncharacterized protein n=1 Tax=Sphingobium phenoxybenzoativorans TaxID=1592790 RepID=A0A975K9F4_9SPHN|nr:hypothetical protein [Sphingobium phenoxybenzoativorans]QUT06799.1 hypothetical protein KFK14_04975 [Sphingobium phenoxybenzoativorans]